MMKRLGLLAGLAFAALLLHSHSALAYTQTRLMDDQVLDNVNSLNQSQIQSFLAGQAGPYTTLGTQTGGPGTPTPSQCLYTTALDAHNGANFHWDGNDWYYGDGYWIGNDTGWVFQTHAWPTQFGPAQIPAYQIIYQAAQMWGINPEVLIATLEKEESLVAGTNCSNVRYWSAMGYDCPDGGTLYNYPDMGVTGTCVNKESKVGLARQVLWGAWQLKFNKERSYGNLAWDGDGNVCYYGFMTQGTRQRIQTSVQGCSSAPQYYDGYASIDGQSIYMENGATAGLYSYTPHLGNSTPPLFEQWFGPAVLPTYAWSIVSQEAFTDSGLTQPVGSWTLNMNPGQTLYLRVRAQNTGTATWQQGGANPVRLGTSGPHDYTSQFCVSGTWINCARPAGLQETSVAPGSTGTFVFPILAPTRAYSGGEHYSLVAEGLTWLNDPGLYYPISVPTPNFTWSIVSQEAFHDSALTQPFGTWTLNMNLGDVAYLRVRAKNTGNAVWSSSNPNPVRIGTAGPRNYTSQFCTNSWLNCSRPTGLQESSVSPGGTGTFVFPIVARGNGQSGDHYSLLAENLTWFNDPGLYYPIYITPLTYSWSIVSQEAFKDSGMTQPFGTWTLNMTPGQTAYLRVKAQNTGTATWSNSGFTPVRLGTSGPHDYTSQFCNNTWINCARPVAMQESSVAPGGTGTFVFSITAPNQTEQTGDHYNLVAETLTWLNDPGLYYPINVGP